MPRPKKGEKKKDFLKRYMESEEAKQTFPDPEQRYSVANSLWKERRSKSRGKRRRRK